MERYESQTENIEVHADDEQSNFIAKAMVSVVAAMALAVVLTVVAFHTGATIA